MSPRRVPRVAVMALALVAGATPARAQAPNARAVLPGIESPILLDTLGIALPITGARDAIHAALGTAFAELGIPIEGRDPRTGMLRNLGAQLSRRLGKEPLSRYLDCGRGFAGNNADIYRITLAISAWLEPPAGAPQRLLVAIAASGRDPAGSGSEYAACTSRGALERRIGARVAELLAAPAGGAA